MAYIESRYPQLHFGWAPLGGLRSASYKFVDAPRRELYDLSVDPGEKHNLADERPDLVEELAAELEMIRGEGVSTEREHHRPDPDTVERLRALGYVTSTVATPATASLDGLHDPKDKIDLFNRLGDARVARRRDDTEEALELLLSVVEEDPDVLLAHLTLGSIYLDTGEYVKAVTSFRTVLDQNAESVEALLGLGRAHQRAGEYREAAETLERCLEIDPRGREAVRSLVEVKLAMGEGRQAESLIRGLSAEEQDESVKLLLASSLLIQRKRREAIDILGEIERQESNDEKILLSLGGLFLKADEEQRGIEAYQRAVRAPTAGVERSREHAEVWNVVGHLLAQRGDLPASAEAFRKAVEQYPSLASAHNNLGIVLAQMERFDAAERSFKRAIQEAPSFAEAFYNLGCLYLQTGRKQQAISVLRRALDIKPDYANARAKLELALADVNPEGDGDSRPPVPF